MSELADATTRGRSAADHLAAEIERMQEGERLGTKKEISQRLGIAGATLNEAIRLLQERGLVTLRPGPKGGIFVAKSDPFTRLGRTLLQVRNEPDLISGAIEVRESLQALAALNALRHRSEADIEVLQDHMAKIEAAVEDEDEFTDSVWRLHEIIAGIGGNRVLETVYRGVLAYVEANEQDAAHESGSPGQRRKLLRVHQQLMSSIIEQDERACRRAIRALDVGRGRPG
jgi:GntR family transcriptional repressor for pyruvate dehydrogenase complex